MMPLIEIPGVPYDYANERPARTLEEHVSAVIERIRKCWTDRSLYVDLSWLDETESLSDGQVAFGIVLDECRRLGIRAIPVLPRTPSQETLDAVVGYSATSRLGACVRLVVDDFEEEVDIEADVSRLVTAFGTRTADSLDLLIDLEDLSYETSRALLIVRSIFSMIPRRDEWRRMIAASASFPEDLSDVNAGSISTLPRREWQLWRTLQRRPTALPRRDLIYGDYAIAHPIPKELDPRTMRMSANIRYTSVDDWLIIKGRNVRQYGFEQYFELCRVLVGRPEYSGRGFSWGDNFIEQCAQGMQGPGNATTWRKVGTNHHLTLVVRALANALNAASGGS